MGFQLNYSTKNIAKAQEAFKKRRDREVLKFLTALGDDCVEYCRSLRTYKNRTGNLRNSIGYVISNRGTVVKANFRRSAEIVKVIRTKSGQVRRQKTLGGKDGVKEGRALAHSLAADNGSIQGLVLIVVAGMEYAGYVENKGFDVITGGSNRLKNRYRRLAQKMS